MTEVQMTQDLLRSMFSYSPETGQFRWLSPPYNHPRLFGAVAGCGRGGYCKIKIGRKAYAAHRLAFLYMTASWPRGVVDHKNGDPLDNRWENLRQASQAQNCANARRKAGKELPKGVRRNRYGYTARIGHQRQIITIGTYKTPTDAARAYAETAARLYGDFARPE